MTEDRIICSEIVTGISPSWRLAYLPSIETVSDSCQSLSELLHQRRRWNNGSFACRLWLFYSVTQLLIQKNLSISRKLSFLTSTPLYIIRSFKDWFNLAWTPLLYILIYQGLRDLITKNSLLSASILDVAFSGEILLLISLFLLYQFGKQSKAFTFYICHL